MAAIITHVDDLHYHEEHGRQVQADETHVIGVDGREFKVDLTAEHADELLKFLNRYEVAGEPVAAGPVKKKAANGSSNGVSQLQLARIYRRRMRAFADSRPDLGERSYLTEGGNHQYTKRLQDEYAEYVAAHGEYPLPDEEGAEAR
jgi:hypothetical protein